MVLYAIDWLWLTANPFQVLWDTGDPANLNHHRLWISSLTLWKKTSSPLKIHGFGCQKDCFSSSWCYPAPVNSHSSSQLTTLSFFIQHLAGSLAACSWPVFFVVIDGRIGVILVHMQVLSPTSPDTHLSSNRVEDQQCILARWVIPP